MTTLKTYMRIAAEERAWAFIENAEAKQFASLCLHKLVAFRVANAADYRNGIILAKQAAREEGLKEGHEEGRREGMEDERKKTARNLLAMDLLTHEQIAQTTGLSVEDIARLDE